MRLLHLLIVGCVLLGSLPGQDLFPATDRGRRLALALRCVGNDGRLLYVTAHPDDENNALLAYYGPGRGMACTLLTVTRGEGGQNEIGTELFEAMGVLRMEELRAAHRWDGAAQRFTRAFEFGYSFSENETFAKWGEAEILRDVVRVVREVRPQVICTMPVFTDGGGRHHQASAFLARRAFDVAAEEVWPELGPPHAADRLFEQIWRGGADGKGVYDIPLDRYDPVLGATYDEVGYQARASHKCQGTGQVRSLRGSGRGSRWRLVLSRGRAPARADDLFADLPVYRDPREADGALSSSPVSFWPGGTAPSPTDPSAVASAVETLLHGSHPSCRRQLRRAFSEAIPLHVEAVARRPEVIPGTTLSVSVLLHNRGPRPISVDGCWIEGRLFADRPARLDAIWTGTLAPGERKLETVRVRIPDDADRWTAVRLARDARPGVERYEDAAPALADLAAFRVVVQAESGGVPLDVATAPVVNRSVDPVFPQARERDVVLVPAVEVGLDPPVLAVPWKSGAEGRLDVRVNARRQVEGRVRVTWSAEGSEVPSGSVDVPVTGEGITHHEVTIPAGGNADGAHRQRIQANWVEGETSRPGVSLQAVDYPHIRRSFLLRPARARIVTFPCVVPTGLRVGYVTGTGDDVAASLERIGLPSSELGSETLLAGDLSQYDVIITGVRAYKVRDDLKRANARLRAWMEAGGRMVVLYNKIPDMNGGAAGRGGSPWVPYPARVGRGRVTVEEAPVRYRVPTHSWFRTPNGLGPADWEGWVQERGLYFLETRDDRYEDLLEMEEPDLGTGNSGTKTGALVTAPVGRGSWTYVGLSLFRQLPAGVPGAYRLLLNILAPADKP